jgi:hypothetical protein
MVCHAQHFSGLHAATKRRVCHIIPAWQWRPITQLSTERPLLHCVTSRWEDPRNTPSACPCSACHGSLKDLAHHAF